ncbi:AbiJ-NTD4 domain-containing protein [Gemmatimonadota bacterium]
MERFSQREGFVPKKAIQNESIDEELKIGLWNCLHIYFWSNSNFFRYDGYRTEWAYEYFQQLFLFIKKPIDDIPYVWKQIISTIKTYFFSCEWTEVYDLVEFIINNPPDNNEPTDLISCCNKILEQESSPWRFVGGKITRITTEEEIAEVERALSLPAPFAPVREHIKTALEKLSDKKAPDYRNAIKESISAVESICKIVTSDNTTTLGKVLKELETKINLHPALKNGFNKLYGYTSDADGIRHGLMEQSDLSFEDAKFFLVACSAFCNYLIAKADKLGFKPVK